MVTGPSATAGMDTQEIRLSGATESRVLTTLAAQTPTASLGTTAPSALAGQDTRETLTTSSGVANSNPAVRTHAVQTPSAPHADAAPSASAQSDTQVTLTPTA